MNEEGLAKMKKLNITLQVCRNWKERLNKRFTDRLARQFGARVGELVQWYVNELFQRYAWEQKRRVELEMILAELCPELMPPYAEKEKPVEPPWWFGSRVA